MTMNPLCRLERVELRSTWSSESRDFTPWLASPENLRLLGDTIGVDLELEGQEQGVGPFRADILCKDTATNSFVLIENQLARTDHTHLGQLITYAAGLKAATIVWIAQPFTEEHRAALDWLNEITDEAFNFFGLEIELWRIGESPVAPKFNVVCKPNDWSRNVRVPSELTDAKALQVAFWTEFRTFVSGKSTTIKATKPLPQNWMNIALGRSGFTLAAVASLWDSESASYESNEVRAELVISVDRASEYFNLLADQKAEIERQLGFEPVWYNAAGVKSCRVFVRRGADLRARTSWPELHMWLLHHLEAFQRVFGPRVRSLTLPALVPV